ncbi:MAG: NHL repeat-containing protein [Candidatus Undinarchaeales archaeon]|nr:NHL repeat-containing protein [Candidatus Undinarchaeales archaeon]MDP7493908.1 NHL repeat-containing protein [Candidatus Undinarchaeales archaeon]
MHSVAPLHRTILVVLAALLLLTTPGTAITAQLSLGLTGTPGSDLHHLNSPGGVHTAAMKTYVADTLNHRVMVFDSLGNHVLDIGTGSPGNGKEELNEPADVFVSNDRIYVADTGNHRIMVYSLTGSQTSSFGFGLPGAGPDNFNAPSGMSVAGDRVYVADTRNHRVVVLTLDGRRISQIGNGEAGGGELQLDRPSRIATDPEHVYIADTGNNRIAVFNHRGEYVTQIATGEAGAGNDQLNAPRGVDVYGEQVYVADTGNNRLQVFDINGTHITTYAGGANTDGVTVASLKDVTATGTTVALADTPNHRVLILDTVIERAPAPTEVPEAVNATVPVEGDAGDINATTAPPTSTVGTGEYGFILMGLAATAGVIILVLAITIYQRIMEGRNLNLVFDLSHGEPVERINTLVPFRREATSGGFVVQTSTDFAWTITNADVLVVLLPTRLFTADEARMIMQQVFDRGMHLLLLGSSRVEMNAAAMNSLSVAAGIRFMNDILCDIEQAGTTSLFTLSPMTTTLVRHRLTEGFRRLKIINSCTLFVEKGSAVAYGGATSFSYAEPSRDPDPTNRRGDTPFMANVDYGRGKIVCLGDARLISSEAPYEHETFIRNLIAWLKKKWPMKGRMPVPPKPKEESSEKGTDGAPPS